MSGLLERINSSVLGRNTWPPPAQRRIWESIEVWGAFRRSDEGLLKQRANVPWHRRYLVSPVPRMLSRAKSNLLYGEPPEIRAAAEADQDNMDRVTRENALAGGHASELHRAAMVASSEGEVWGRLLVDPTLADVPILEFVSRRQVIPKFRGRFVVGATFVFEWQESSRVVYRLLEHYEAGQIRCELFRGSPQSIGSEVGLDTYERTKGKEPVVLTGFDRPLCSFIPNSIDADPTVGFGDYRGLEERFLAINEAATIAQENLRLAGKKRALVDAKYLRNGKLPAGDDLFVRSEEMSTAGESGKPLQLVEYAFEAEQLRIYLDQLIDTTLVFGGAAPQLVGRAQDGGAISGTALRLKMVHSLMESSGTGGHFDRGLSFLLRAMAVLDSRPTTQGGFGRRWQKPDEDHAIERSDGLPRDDQEAAQWLVMVAGAEAISLEEKVAFLHPDWSDDRQRDEVERLRKEQGGEGEEPPPGGGGDPPSQLPPGPGQPPIPTPRPPTAPALPADQ